MLLKDKVAIVTGAASNGGIGRTAAERFAEEGAKVIILDVSLSDAEAAAAQLGPDHLGLEVDVTDEAAIAKAVAQTIERYGRIDILVNNAGVSQPAKTVDITRSEYDLILDVNLRGTLLCSQAVIPHMLQAGGGSIVCVSSVSGQRGGGILGGPHYAAAKAGVLGLARAMARELAPNQIRVNCVAPSLIVTAMTAGRLSEEKEREVLAAVPLGRPGKALDVANSVLFLASDLSSYLTGVTLDVNGGMHIH